MNHQQYDIGLDASGPDRMPPLFAFFVYKIQADKTVGVFEYQRCQFK